MIELFHRVPFHVFGEMEKLGEHQMRRDVRGVPDLHRASWVGPTTQMDGTGTRERPGCPMWHGRERPCSDPSVALPQLVFTTKIRARKPPLMAKYNYLREMPVKK